MKPFDPEYQALSSSQLAAIDLLCDEYESRRTMGEAVSPEEFPLQADPEIRWSLRLELIRTEMEILDTWDQLQSPESLVQRFPDLADHVRLLFEALKNGAEQLESVKAGEETQNLTGPTDGTRDDFGKHQSRQQATSSGSAPASDTPRFQIVRKLARGGIGTVFVARDNELHREVALKELKRKFASDGPVVRRFAAEASVTGNLEHPNIVPVYAAGIRTDGRPFYVMRLIHGRSMQVAISELHARHGPDLDFRRDASARDLMHRLITVCRATGFAHSRGVLHRDLKPGNVMVGDFGETLVVDWGLANKINPTHPSEPSSGRSSSPEWPGVPETLSGTIVGTPGYMSPEQAAGRNGDVSFSSDIYSLGAILLQLLTNSVAKPATGPVAATDGGSEIDSPPGHVRLSDRLGASPPPLAAICRRAMNADPRCRYESADLLASDLEAWLADQPVTALTESRFQKLRRRGRAHPALAGAAMAGLVITVLAMGITLRILSAKNESLRLANHRETVAGREAVASAESARVSEAEAVHQRQRVLGILNAFLIDVERGLANVPGGAAVQRNVLTTVLNKLGDVSAGFGDDNRENISNAMALIDLGDLFSRVGIQDVKLNLNLWNHAATSPLEASGLMYAEAMKVAGRLPSVEGEDPRRLIALIRLKQAQILRQTARTTEALELTGDSLSLSRILLDEAPESVQAAIDVVMAVDQLGQIHLQNGKFPEAKTAFAECRDILLRLPNDEPPGSEIRRLLGLSFSRLGDIAVHEGDLDSAALSYDQDLAITSERFLNQPDDGLAKRDLCVSLDRSANLLAKQGKTEEAVGAWNESRRLREELHAAEPLDRKTGRELMVSCMKLGDARMSLKDVTTAKADYLRALAIADELARTDPQDSVARRFQSMSAEVLADVAIEQEQLDDALHFAERSLEISIELAARDPADGQTQRDLYICHAKVAKVCLARKEFDDCLRQLNLALAITGMGFEQQPESLQAISDHNSILLRIAQARLESGDPQAAIQDCETVISIHESIPEASRQDATLKRRLANTWTLLGRALLAAGQSARAREALERSRALTLAMIGDGQRVEQMKLDLAEIETLLASITDR